MLHPTRTNLLILRDKAHAVGDSIQLLKGRRQGLLREFLSASLPLLQSRERLARLHAEGIAALAEARRTEGDLYLRGVAGGAQRDFGLHGEERNLLGLRYFEVGATVDPRRAPWLREYDEAGSDPQLEEAIDRFEAIVAGMLAQAVFEGKVKRLGEELLRLTRRIRVLEERVLPELRDQARTIARFLGEREREAFFRLKRFKTARTARDY